MNKYCSSFVVCLTAALISSPPLLAQEPLNKKINEATSNTTNPSPFASINFLPYKKNYLTAGKRNNSDGTPAFSGNEYEAHFQFSFMVPVSDDNSSSLNDWYIAYSQKAWWDIAESSMPFAEINFNPEIFYKKSFISANNKHTLWISPYEHESNGRDGTESRSWNRAYLRYMYTNKSSDHENKLGLKVWAVLNKATENDNIRREYLGSYHVYASYWADNKHLDITYRPGKNNRDAIEISASHSIFDSLNLKLYIKYFKGFGENLTSYDKETESYHMGVIIKHPILN